MQVEQKIRQFVLGILMQDIETTSITDDSSLFEQGVIDSLSVIQLLAFVDAEFDVQIRPEEVNAENFDSINRLTTYINGKLASAPISAAA